MKNLFTVLLALGSLIIFSCSKDVPVEPSSPSASITWNDTTYNFIPNSRTVYNNLFQQYVYIGKIVLLAAYVNKPTSDATYILPNCPVALNYSGVGANGLWQSISGSIKVSINGSCITTTFSNVVFQNILITEPNVAASGYITTK
jgi:hypothetical protein